MFGVLRKDLFRSTIHVMILILLTAVYWIMTAETLNPGMVLMLGGLIYILTMSSVMINEQDEDKNHGYTFLQALPLTVREIVMAKFALPFFIVAFIVGFAFVLFVFFSGTPQWLAVSRVFILMNGAFSLVITALIYIGIYRFGYMRFIRLFLVFVMVLGLVPQILLFRFMPHLKNIDFAQVVEYITHINPFLIIACSLALYGGLMIVAIRVKGTAASEL